MRNSIDTEPMNKLSSEINKAILTLLCDAMPFSSDLHSRRLRKSLATDSIYKECSARVKKPAA